MEVQGENPERSSSLLDQTSCSAPQGSPPYRAAGVGSSQPSSPQWVKETLTELRSRFWVIRGRNLVKNIIRQCHICRRHEGRPYSAPRPPPLPVFRVEEASPFTFTGVDFAGPLYIKSESGTNKVWICLYTCCVVRAVHLELVMDMTTPAFLRSFRRFVGREDSPARWLVTMARRSRQPPRPCKMSSGSSMFPRPLGGGSV